MQATSMGFYNIVNSEALCKIHFAKKFPRTVDFRPTDQDSMLSCYYRGDIPFNCIYELDPNSWKTNFLIMHTRKSI